MAAGARLGSSAAAHTGCQALGVARVGPARFVEVGRINPRQLRMNVVHTFFKSSLFQPGKSDQPAATNFPCRARGALSGKAPGPGTVSGASGLATPGSADSGGVDTVEHPAINTTSAAKLRRKALFCIALFCIVISINIQSGGQCGGQCESCHTVNARCVAWPARTRESPPRRAHRFHPRNGSCPAWCRPAF